MSEVDVRSPRPPVDWPSLLLLAAIAVFLVVDAWVIATTPYLAPPSAVVRELLFAVSWVGVGVVALWLHRAALAHRILALSLVLSADFVGSFGLLSDDLVPRLLITLTSILVPLQTAFAAHLLVSYPTGRLVDRFGARLVTTAYVVGGLEGAWWALTHVSMNACEGCARSYTLIGTPEAVHRVVASAFAGTWVVLSVLLVVLLIRRYSAAGHRQRRLLRLPYVSIVLAAALYAYLSLVAAPRGVSAWGLSREALIALQVVALLGVPLSFLIGLLHERLSYKRIGELVVELAGYGDGDADLERSLAVALGDPHLQLAFPVTDGFVDTRGRPVSAPTPDGRTAVTSVGDSDSPMALIGHDASLSEEPALLTAAGSATRLILENARLQAEVRAQLLEVRESRARIVAASNEARARLERDLHDGAQQRLLAIGIALQLLRQQPGDRAVLEAAEEELASALAEMRELASGIHPAVLTDLGLVAALEALATRLGSQVRLHVPNEVRRSSPEVEAAAYFSAAEAATNALKHAAPAPVDITVLEREDGLTLQVSDGGPGGADPGGSGLVGVRDRLASVGGTLTVRSPAGGGTDLEMVIPCA